MKTRRRKKKNCFNVDRQTEGRLPRESIHMGGYLDFEAISRRGGRICRKGEKIDSTTFLAFCFTREDVRIKKAEERRQSLENIPGRSSKEQRQRKTERKKRKRKKKRISKKREKERQIDRVKGLGD